MITAKEPDMNLTDPNVIAGLQAYDMDEVGEKAAHTLEVAKVHHRGLVTFLTTYLYEG